MEITDILALLVPAFVVILGVIKLRSLLARGATPRVAKPPKRGEVLYN